MRQKEALKIARHSIKENRDFLTALGTEKKVKPVKLPEEDLVSKILNYLPKSTEGKIALVGIALLVYLILRK